LRTDKKRKKKGRKRREGEENESRKTLAGQGEIRDRPATSPHKKEKD